MLRETVGLVEKRREEVCIAVEMELAGVQALCDFYGLELYDILRQAMYWKPADMKWKVFMQPITIWVNYILHWKQHCSCKS